MQLPGIASAPCGANSTIRHGVFMNTPSNETNSQPEPVQEAFADASKADAAPPRTDEALAKLQVQYRLAYLEQLRRMSCPGCGDDGLSPLRLKQQRRVHRTCITLLINPITQDTSCHRRARLQCSLDPIRR